MRADRDLSIPYGGAAEFGRVAMTLNDKNVTRAERYPVTLRGRYADLLNLRQIQPISEDVRHP